MRKVQVCSDDTRQSPTRFAEVSPAPLLASTRIAIRFKRNKSREFAGNILALSTQSCTLETPFELEPNTRIFIRIPGQETIVGHTIRIDKLQADVVFQRAIHRSVLEHILRRYSDPAVRIQTFASGISLEFAVYKLRAEAMQNLDRPQQTID
ncbi:hypothetical protein [Sphingomonas sp. PWP1-2]|uniref:hypothetical protein n=1 Tax=Sphingomonas sp. PWP1-2 TaxID=2804558 RepID=UPI003CF1242B